MNRFELVTQLRNLMVGSGSSQSLLRRASVLGAFCSLLVLGACGKSASTLSPDGQNGGTAGIGTGDGGSQSAGTPSAKFAFSTSDLTLIKQTSGTNGWVTILSSPLKTPAAKEVYASVSLEAGLYTQTLVRSKNNKKDTSTASVAESVCVRAAYVTLPGGIGWPSMRVRTWMAALAVEVSFLLFLLLTRVCV